MPRLASFGRSGLWCFSRARALPASSLRRCVFALLAARRRWPNGRLALCGFERPSLVWRCADGTVGVLVEFRPSWDGSFTFWERACGFYYDPFFWSIDARYPDVSPLPRVLPRTRCWVMAFWSAAFVDRG